jgi:iron complex transport system ATP-binding protein
LRLNAPRENSSQIEVEGLSFSYRPAGPVVIRDLTAGFGPSKLNIIIGPNGSGKSTLARIVIGYLAGYKGNVKIDGDDLRSLTTLETARRVAFVPQENPVSAPLTVRDAVELGRFCRMAGGVHPREQDARAIEDALELTGIKELSAHRLDSISGGEKQRAMLARALAQGAGNLVLDEPTANLDIKYQPLIFGLLRRLVDEKRYNVLAITHDVNLASRYADRVFLLKDGGIFAAGAPTEVVRLDILEEAYETKLKAVGEDVFIPLGRTGNGGAS